MTYRIRGGKPLIGSVTVSGSKNAALPILFASLLFSEPVTVENLPAIRDTDVALRLLERFSVKITRKESSVTLDPRSAVLPDSLPEAGMIRAGIYLCGAALPRFGKISLPLPGGCDFGNRPIGFHLDAFRAMGATVTVTETAINVEGKPKAVDFCLPFPSVGATVNLLLAAVLTPGITRIRNPAAEPHVLDLILFLRKGGANITVENGVITVSGVHTLHAVRHRLIGDMIEAGSYLSFAAATGGEVLLRGVCTDELRATLSLLKEMGANVACTADGVFLSAHHRLRPIVAETAPYPAFPTDMQPLFTALTATARGVSRLTDTIYPNRFRFLTELRKMGLNAVKEGNTVCVYGVNALHPAFVTVPDLRGGAALLLAALSTHGESRVENAELILRGYSDPDRKLSALGADIAIV